MAGRFRRASRMRDAALRSGDPNDPSISMLRERRRHQQRGNVWLKLGMKLVTYGVVMVVLRYNKSGGKKKELPSFLRWLEPYLKTGGNGKDDAVLGEGVRTIRLATAHTGSSGAGGANNDDAAAAAVAKQLAYVVPNFLPPETVDRWRDTLLYEWVRQEQVGGGAEGGGAFNFVSVPLPPPSSNDGGSGSGDAGSVEARNATAHAARAAALSGIGTTGSSSSSSPSMARWELDPVHPLTGEVRRTLGGSGVLQKIDRIIVGAKEVKGGSHNAVGVEEARVVHYSLGDFLFEPGGGAAAAAAAAAANSDAAATAAADGATTNSRREREVRWHLILPLPAVPSAREDRKLDEEKEFDDDDRMRSAGGGTLRFGCPPPASTGAKELDTREEWCETVDLTFNAAVIFATTAATTATGGSMPRYEIMPLDWTSYGVHGYRNFGVVASFRRMMLGDGDDSKMVRDQEL